MTTRTLFVLIGFYSLVPAGGLAALNVVYAYRLAMRGEGPRPIPGLVTLLGLVALRTLELSLYRPWIFSFWSFSLVILADAGSWLVPPLVWERFGHAALEDAVAAPPASRPPSSPRTEARPALTLRPRPPGAPSPFAKKPQSPPRDAAR